MLSQTIAIIANGEATRPDLTRKITENVDIIIATDGGIKTCLTAGIQPHYIIGDMDSSTEEEREFFAEASIIRDSDQETTDMQKALRFAASLEPRLIKLLSALGKRADHSIANLLILHEFNRTCPVEIYDNYGKLSVLAEGHHVFKLKKGRTISFFSFGPISRLSLMGFRYNLSEQDYPSCFAGISNVVEEAVCEVNFEKGSLFMYEVFE